MRRLGFSIRAMRLTTDTPRRAFILKRGGRDVASGELAEAKAGLGWGDRAKIQTWVDLHEAEEGRL